MTEKQKKTERARAAFSVLFMPGYTQKKAAAVSRMTREALQQPGFPVIERIGDPSLFPWKLI
jgi:hypothetical protein